MKIKTAKDRILHITGPFVYKPIDIIKKILYKKNIVEKLIFSSPKKYKILEIKRLLTENDIPISSIQLYIYVNMTRYHRGVPIIDEREKRGELNVPIEEFNGKLNDAEALEIYTEENYVDKAINLIEDFNNKNFYNDCIFQSRNYEEADNIQRILIKNEIPCDDVITNFLYDNTEEYLIFLDPEFHVKAENILENNFKQEVPVEKRVNIQQNEDIQFSQDNEWGNQFVSFFKFLFVILIIIVLIFIFDKKYPFLEKVLNLITELIKNIKQ